MEHLTKKGKLIMLVKNIIANSPIVKSFMNWLKGQYEIGNTGPDPNKLPPLILIKVVEDYPIADLINKNLHVFQRKLQLRRLIKIALKVLKFGYLYSPIMLDDLFKMIDGQHRVVVAYLLGYETVPVAIYRFRSSKVKADVFAELSQPEGGPPAIMDRIDSRKIAGYPYESMIHRLIMNDSQSSFYDAVNYKGATHKSKMSLPVFVKIFNWIGLGIRRKWDDGYDSYLQHTCQQMDNVAYVELRERLNIFMRWFSGWSGAYGTNKDLYKERVLTGFMDFYLSMIEHAPTTRELARLKRESIQRFKGYQLSGLLQYDFPGVMGAILKQYNRGRLGQNRIPVIDLGIRVRQVWGDETDE